VGPLLYTQQERKVNRTAILAAACFLGCGGPNPVGNGNDLPKTFDASVPKSPLNVSSTGGTLNIGTIPTGSAGESGTAVHGFDRCPAQADGGCVGSLYTGQPVGLDIFIMFDVSGSMATKDDGTTMRIDAVRGAIKQFLQAPESAGLGVGIGYFGTQPLSCGCTSCKPDDYATPSVAVGELPGQATSLLSSLDAAKPTGETPTGAALRGSCRYARQVAAARPGHDMVILLVTDGEPQAPVTSPGGTCTPTLADAVGAASECNNGSSIRTYVLGVGPSLQKLNQIADAGGSKQAYLVESGGGGEVLQALNRIRSDARIPCALQLPQSSGATLDLNTVNVVSADSSCAMTTIGMVPNAAACPETGGWYYDDPTQARSLRLCEASCLQVSAPGSQLRVSVGCRTQIIY
jgi:hypothetical protein